MNTFKSHPIGLITLVLMLLMVACTSQEERMMQYKEQVRLVWPNELLN
ncbi:MAG: hypothetical protein ABFS56_26025 [Pseudomonadota bacterium]